MLYTLIQFGSACSWQEKEIQRNHLLLIQGNSSDFVFNLLKNYYVCISIIEYLYGSLAIGPFICKYLEALLLYVWIWSLQWIFLKKWHLLLYTVVKYSIQSSSITGFFCINTDRRKEEEMSGYNKESCGMNYWGFDMEDSWLSCALKTGCSASSIHRHM